MSTDNALESIPVDQQGSFSSFLKTLASFTGDLSALTCPSFLLAPISLLEYSSYWADQPTLLSSVGDSDNAEERFHAAIKWFISALNGSFASRLPKGEWEKKPFNPILGEQFFCQLGDAKVTCQQVSHHPPVSAFHIRDEKKGVTLLGHDGQKTRFSGTQMLVDQIGYCTLKLEARDETYLFTLPSLSVNGIWYAAPYVELYGTSYVQSSSGFHASIAYTTKGWISGEIHHFKATVTNDNDKSAPATIIEGQWTGKSTLTKGKQAAVPFLDLTEVARCQPQVAPIAEQDELESRRLWQKVSDALIAGDYMTASTEKSAIENAQRALRKERAEQNIEWKPTHYKQVDGTEIYGNLRQQITDKADSNFVDTMGDSAWQFTS
ncbi:hypothetical protein BC940DRAFT_310643 [Gongronella butleri]|nr:hypothetical protein BC940DRAFT_310643 [Gongronella butleri]